MLIGRYVLIGLTLSSLGACSSMAHMPQAVTLDPGASIVVLPTINNTETPLAGERMDDLANSLLPVLGLTSAVQTPAEDTSRLPDGSPHDRWHQEQALAWSKQQHVRYALAISLMEWRYKVGLDGEPAVGMNVSILDVDSGHILWSGSAARSGWGRQAVSSLALDELHSLLRHAITVNSAAVGTTQDSTPSSVKP